LLLKEHTLKGNEYFCKKDYEKAIKYYDKALKIDPKDAHARFNVALASKNEMELQK
jgi:tetratricopeptide (TPR) repeat protein